MLTAAIVEVAIRTTVMDYVEGWYDGDVERMNRSLHPRLAKRALKFWGESSEPTFVDLTKVDMMRYTMAGGGSDVPRDKLYYKVIILDVYEETATVRAESSAYIDYLHLVKENDQWLIVNVLYTINRATTK
jgi:hypothetical protein